MSLLIKCDLGKGEVDICFEDGPTEREVMSLSARHVLTTCSAVERTWHLKDSHGQVLAMAFG